VVALKFALVYIGLTYQSDGSPEAHQRAAATFHHGFQRSHCFQHSSHASLSSLMLFLAVLLVEPVRVPELCYAISLPGLLAQLLREQQPAQMESYYDFAPLR
jgi:hypothetical protein